MTLPRRTHRLIVRAYTMDDADDVARVLGDPRVALQGDAPMTREEALDWLREEIGYARRDWTGRYAIALRETDEVVGGCGLVRRELDEGIEVELGYHLRSDLWGRGLATEAAAECLDEARERGLRRVIAFIRPGNIRSEAVARRLGMRPEMQREWFGSLHAQWAADLRATMNAPPSDEGT